MTDVEEYIGHEVYFPGDDPPQEVIDRLKAYGFIQSFYIPRGTVEIFKSLAHPYKIDFMQPNIILGGYNTEDIENKFLDMINELKAAGVGGIDNFINKVKQV